MSKLNANGIGQVYYITLGNGIVNWMILNFLFCVVKSKWIIKKLPNPIVFESRVGGWWKRIEVGWRIYWASANIGRWWLGNNSVLNVQKKAKPVVARFMYYERFGSKLKAKSAVNWQMLALVQKNLFCNAPSKKKKKV